MLINPADGRRYSSTAHEVANAKTPGEQKSAEKDELVTQVILKRTGSLTKCTNKECAVILHNNSVVKQMC